MARAVIGMGWGGPRTVLELPCWNGLSRSGHELGCPMMFHAWGTLMGQQEPRWAQTRGCWGAPCRWCSGEQLKLAVGCGLKEPRVLCMGGALAKAGTA